MKKESVSVVIPTFNEEKYLAKTLQSLKELTVLPLEILCVDSNSTDGTKKICLEHNVRFIQTDIRGVGFARQLGLEHAKGMIVAYTDADTVVPKDWLKKIVEALEVPSVVGVYGEYRVIDGPFWYKWFINYIQPYFWKCSRVLFRRDIPGGQNIACWREKGLLAGGFPKGFQSVEDFEFVRRLNIIGKVSYVKDNYVLSSGRRGLEGLRLIPRVIIGISRYFITGKAETFTFPAIR